MVRTLGEFLVTAGLLLLLYVAYTLFWTNVEADRQAGKIVSALRDDWARPVPTPSRTTSPGATRTAAPTTAPPAAAVRIDKGFALMYIPRLGASWVSPVVEGIGTAQLARGVGHYPGTAQPGQVGNFAVAGHRSTHGEPFAQLDKLRPGDRAYVQTRAAWYEYVVDSTEIVAPTKISVLLPVPNRPGVAPTRPLMTLTTCHPRWGSTSRLIVYTHLVTTTPGAGPPAGVPG